MTNSYTAKLHTPPQDLAAPSLFAANVEAASAWLAALPKANLGQTARAVYRAVNELNRVKLLPSLRLQLLETIRPAVHLTSAGLRRHYINQPIVLSEQARQVARLTHELHEQLAIGYTLCATETIALGKQSGFAQLPPAIATAAQRGIAEHSLNLLRDYQLYRDPHPGCWSAIHQLALLAREWHLEATPIADAQCGDHTLQANYLRALLLGSAKSSQLRQDDLNKIFQHAPAWSALVKFSDRNALLVFDPHSDDAPIYRQFAAASDNWLGLDTTQLALHLAQQRERAEAASAFGEQHLSADLLAHLAHTWGSVSTRAFLRVDVQEQINIALGLTATHHFLAGEGDFQTLLNSVPQATLTLQDDNPFLRAHTMARTVKKDVWDTAYAPGARLTEISIDSIDYHIRQEQEKTATAKEREKYRSHSVERVNISPGGFCVSWPPTDPAQLRTGEIIGINEQRNPQWSIGVVRWLRSTTQGPQLGIELLSPCAHPFGARAIHKSGPQGDYLRALVLPAVKQTGQPTTLLVPRLAFRAGQKVSLLCHDRETRVQLIKKVASTPSFSLFEFRRLSAIKLDADSGPSHDDSDGFEQLWDSL